MKPLHKIESFSVPEELVKVYTGYCQEKDINKSQFIRKAIRELLEKESK